MNYKVHLQSRDFLSLMRENTGSIGVSLEGMQGLKLFAGYENREDLLKDYLRKKLSQCRDSETREILDHILFEIEYIDYHQDKITKEFSRFFTWIIAENQSSNRLLMKHDPLKWTDDLIRTKRERENNNQISLFERRNERDQREQKSLEKSNRQIRFEGNHRGCQGTEKLLSGFLYEYAGKEKSGTGNAIPIRST